MTRFFLSDDAKKDLQTIRDYLNGVPAQSDREIVLKIRRSLANIARDPYLGVPHSGLTRLLGVEVRSRLAPPYRIFYRLGGTLPRSSPSFTPRATCTPCFGNASSRRAVD